VWPCRTPRPVRSTHPVSQTRLASIVVQEEFPHPLASVAEAMAIVLRVEKDVAVEAEI
jgi:hypothetical protein